MAGMQGSVRDPYLYEVHNENGPGMDAVHVVAGSGGRGTRACRNQVRCSPSRHCRPDCQNLAALTNSCYLRSQAFTAGDCLEEHGYNVVEVNRKQMTMRFHDTRCALGQQQCICRQYVCLPALNAT